MRRALAWLAVALAVGLAAVVPVIGPATPARADSYTPIAGSGSTWSENAIRQWVSDVASDNIPVSYNGTGSSAGRRDFAQRLNDFGVSEIPFQGTDPATGSPDTANGRQFAYMPIVAGGTSFMYHLTVGGKLYRDLRLSGETVAKIFTGQITSWDDPAITRDNNGKSLPRKRIVPLIRSDGSGTTAQFTLWMAKQQPNIWCPFYAAKVGRGGCGLTSYYPSFGNAVGQASSTFVAGYISAAYGDGTIGYVEYSYAHAKDYPVAKIRNAAGYYVGPTDYNVAVALTKARINQDKNSQDYLTQILDDVYTYNDKRTYPLSSYSYMILPLEKDGRFSEAKGKTLSKFAHYFLCQGQQSAEKLGFSPLPLNLVKAGFEQVARVLGAEGATLTPNGCDNPTFDPSNPESNRLARTAPMPPDCDKEGQGPCSGGATAGGGGGSTGGGSGNGAGGTTENGPAGGGPGPQVDPVTGEVQASAGGDGGSGPVELASGLHSVTGPLTVLGGVELLALVLVPALVAHVIRRRYGARPAADSATETNDSRNG